jgi:predicted TPR repeat methyltransferase
MNQPLFLSSGDLIADRRFTFAQDLVARGDLAAAAELLAQTVEAAPLFAAAWFALGDIRERCGDREGAARAFHEALAADPQDRLGATPRLSRLGAAAGAMPRGYVRALFDQYAPAFDRALTEGLNYRGPALLREAIAAACERSGRALHFLRVLDLGCGTGLAGAEFRAHAGFLEGVDLSERMIAQARDKTIYDRLHAGDLIAFLHGTRESYDLVLAADVFVYVADLAGAARGVARILLPGGLFAFTTETYDGDDVILRETLRFAHSRAYVERALRDAGLEALSIEPLSARVEKGVPVPGLVAVAAAPGAHDTAGAKS